MGLFGALFAGVSGLDSQSNKIGIISNNISNVNTVGFKQGQAAFNTLVVPSATTGTFSPGGVIGANKQLVSQQGIIAATTSSTDIAISGGGLLVVNTKPDGSGQTLYTRAGSFTQDANGDFLNTNGYYLQGLPILADGSTAQANAQNLKTVSISQSATGAATATSNLSVAANLNAAQTVLQGPGEVTSINPADLTNVNNTGTQIIVPTTGNGLVVGDSFQILSTGTNGTAPADVFTYGGFKTGRDITTGDPSSTDPTNILDTETSPGITTTSGDNKIVITVANVEDFMAGNYASINDVTSNISGLTPDELNGDWPIISTSGGTGAGTITLQVGGNADGSAGTLPDISNRSYNFQGNILDATTDSGDFLAKSGTSNFAPDALQFQIITGGVTSTFKYNAVPNTSQQQFNSLNTLVQAINSTTGLTASVVNHQLYISATDANQSVSFANVNDHGDSTLTPPTYGINWVQELDLQDIPQNTDSTVHYFNSLSGLAEQINTVDPTNLVASVSNPTSTTPTLSVHEANPLQTVQISDTSSPANAGHSLIKELGFTGPNGSQLTEVGTNPQILTTGILEATYAPTDNTRNMSSGAVTAQYSKDITIYDAQGASHTLALNFAKLNTNTWAVEATVIPATDINPASNDGQVAYGTLVFDGSGGLQSATGSIASTNGFPINWTNGADAANIVMDLGVGGSTGIIQTAGAFAFSNATQNGSPVGELTGVSIDSNGYVIASFSNGQTQKVYQVPLASVNNPDGLESVSGDAYIQTLASGIANLQFAGTSGVGTFTPSALEQSNVDLSTQLTDLIVAQQAYGANSKVLTIADQLLQQLDQIIQ